MIFAKKTQENFPFYLYLHFAFVSIGDFLKIFLQKENGWPPSTVPFWNELYIIFCNYALFELFNRNSFQRVVNVFLTRSAIKVYYTDLFTKNFVSRPCKVAVIAIVTFWLNAVTKELFSCHNITFRSIAAKWLHSFESDWNNQIRCIRRFLLTVLCYVGHHTLLYAELPFLRVCAHQPLIC